MEEHVQSALIGIVQVLKNDKQGLDSGSFALYCFDRARMVGVLAVNRPDAERKPMQHLVQARVLYKDLANKLQDETVNLSKVVS